MTISLKKQQCTSVDTFSILLQQLNNEGYVNVCHHTPSALCSNEYIICTQQGCRLCANTTGLSIVWRGQESIQALSA